jgi:predicted permease
MSAALLVLPDFLIIIFGWLLNRKFGLSRKFFVSLEKLIYYVVFPALLLQSIVRIPISMSTAAVLFFATAAVLACGIVLLALTLAIWLSLIS